MPSYNPDIAPSAADWLALSEDERMELVSSHHRRLKIKLPNTELHAVIHVVVENQLAMGESIVVATLARLQAEGLDRHDALHAIGSVLSGYIYDLMREESDAKDVTYARYLEGLERLSASSWRAS
jgi:hypothetical protein